MKKNRTQKIILPFSLAIIISVLLSFNCFAYTGFTYTPLHGQETNYWCWAASDQMLLETQWIVLSQTTVAGGINRQATLAETKNRLSSCAPYLQWDVIYSPVNISGIENTIDSGWAILAACQSSSSGHMMVITGYDINYGGSNYVWLQDPWGNSNISPHSGEEDWCNLTSLSTGNYSGSVFLQCQGLIWVYTIC